jgi:hypothetical protein
MSSFIIGENKKMEKNKKRQNLELSLCIAHQGYLGQLFLWNFDCSKLYGITSKRKNRK